MKTIPVSFLFAAIISILVTACSGQVPGTQAVQDIGLTSISEVETTSPTATQEELAAPVQPQFAPFCDAASSSGCQSPDVTMIDPKYCVDRVPYVIISVPPGTSYESLDPDMQCVDQTHSDGNLRVTCHSLSGKDNWSYDLKLCNIACNPSSLEAGTGQCPEGYGYDAVKVCCAAPPPASADGCTIFQVDLTVCFGQ